MMDYTAIISFSIFASIAAITPGPNNLMLAASGANYGAKRTIPHLLGVTIGFLCLILAAGLGLSGLFTALPQLYDIMRVLSLFFLVYLAWKIANAGPIEEASASKPLSFGTAFLFQWVNPKGTTVTISTITAYTSSTDSFLTDLTLIIVIFGITTLISTIAWTIAGQFIGTFLQDKKRRQIFNYVMAGLLVAALLPVILSL